MTTKRRGPPEYLLNLLFGAILNSAMLMPYQTRVRFMGWVVAQVVAPIAGWDRRVRDNLALVWPDLPGAEVDRLARQVPNTAGRALIESYSGQGFIQRCTKAPMHGPGLKALEEAHAQARPVILVTGHFGNHQAPRAALIAKGYRVGGLYMPMSNGFFNDRYVAELSKLGTPLFERSRQGLAEMVKFLRSGGMVGMVADHYMAHGTPINFLGKPAYTALSAAEMALKYDALVVPIYGRRGPDGLSLEIIVDAPVPHSDPLTMTKALNASLERFVKETPDQWFWIHRRWQTPK